MLNSLVGIIASSGGVAGGDYESIATVTVGAGGSSTITFTSIPSTYQHLQLRSISRSNRADVGEGVLIRVNSDSGNNYTFHWLYGTGSAAAVQAVAPYSGFRPANSLGNSATSNTFGSSVIDFLDYGNGNKNKTMRAFGGYDTNSSGEVGLYSGVWMNTNAITRIDIIPIFGTAFNQYSSFALYGIKG